MSKSVEGTIVRTYELNANPERVYRAFTSKEDLQNWKEENYEIDARKGGAFKMGLESEGYAVTGEFLELVPNEKVVYTWKINEYDEKGKLIPNFSQEKPTKVTVKFEKAGSRGTKVTLIHEGFPENNEEFYQHETGWDLLIGQVLKAYLEKTPEDYSKWWENEEPHWQEKWQRLSEEKTKSKLVQKST